MSLIATTPSVKVGAKPRFSARVRNGTGRAVRLLDIREGRRPDLQESYFELVVTRDGEVVDVPIVISDPGPIDDTDVFELTPGRELEVRDVKYTRDLSELPVGEYEAFVLFWRDTPTMGATRCRSASTRFVIGK